MLRALVWMKLVYFKQTIIAPSLVLIVRKVTVVKDSKSWILW